VDFSGSEKDGSKKIWIAEGCATSGKLRIDDCQAAAERFGNMKLSQTLAKLCQLISGKRNCVFGFDFPFGLPCALVEKATWKQFLLAFPKIYTDANSLRDACRTASGRKELKRLTDARSVTPFSPYNLRIYQQTYWGLAEVIRPLVNGGHALALPMQNLDCKGKAILLEVCPASTLAHERQSDIAEWSKFVEENAKRNPSYKKGTAGDTRAIRERILSYFEGKYSLSFAVDEVRTRVLNDVEGDALDSVIAAFAAHRALNDGFVTTPTDRRAYRIEGYVYL
jgi:hypothetical protein